ncbi:MAG: hypothetical protein IJY67_10950 [Paludibacteraceae bacterium]|nr:hypothetical protein [Paludibacteraceae bacterium]
MPNDAKIIVAATHDKLHKVRDHLAIAGTINALDCIFEFRTDEWSGTTKTAIFVAGQVLPTATEVDGVEVLLDDTNECPVPSEVLVDNNVFSVGVYGSKENYRIVTNWLYFRIRNGSYVPGSTPSDPTPSVYEQLLDQINKIDTNSYYTKEEINKLLNMQNGIGTLDAGPIIET